MHRPDARPAPLSGLVEATADPLSATEMGRDVPAVAGIGPARGRRGDGSLA